MLGASRLCRFAIRSKGRGSASASSESAATAAKLNARMGKGMLPSTLGFHVDAADADSGRVDASMEITERHLAPNGFCHAASIIALADSACGAGTYTMLPREVENFTTLSLQSNFIGTATSGKITCTATQLHGGRTTQVWDATVFDSKGKKIALFRCTQLLLQTRK
jgi:1,4-dihydroxy-2-naphthoyl-CoA hydrolase